MTLKKCINKITNTRCVLLLKSKISLSMEQVKKVQKQVPIPH